MHRKKLFVILACGLLILVLNNCINKKEEGNDYRGNEYAGSEKCSHCHQEIFDDYIKTAHSQTSSPATLQTIRGSFAADSNTLQYRPSVRVIMKQTDSGFYQIAYLDDVPKQAARFDMVMGSGSKGQSYLSWLGNTVYQLPVSYFAPGKSWINSPGYPPKYVLFNRNIPVGCFECHSSFIKRTSFEVVNGYLVDHFDTKQIIYGIDCERCHGPLAAHVKYQEDNPQAKTARFITSIGSLQRQEKLDMCAICHSGAVVTTKASFHYQPGEKLSEYIQADYSKLTTPDVDVHGKQYQLLSASQCFLKSQTLTCITCHNPHQNEKGNLAFYSSKCMGCHSNPNHISPDVVKILQKSATVNCIDCHMPAKPSHAITMKSSNQNDSISAYVRTHYISVYR